MTKQNWLSVFLALMVLIAFILMLRWMDNHDAQIYYPNYPTKKGTLELKALPTAIPDLPSTSLKPASIGLYYSVIIFQPTGTPRITQTPSPTPLPTALPKNGEKRIGRASWYDQTRLLRKDLLLLAGDKFGVASRFFDKGTILKIKNLDNGKEIEAAVNDWCQCYAGEETERLADLSKEAFAYLSDNKPELGLLRVEIKNEKIN